MAMHLELSPIPQAKCYKLESATRLRQGGQVLEYHEVMHVDLALLGADQGAWIFQLTTQPVQAQATSEVFTWARQVNSFLDRLVLRVGRNGRIEGVLNQEELLSRWPAHKQALKRDFGDRPGANEMLLALDLAVKQPSFMLTQLTSNGIYDFLFPGLYEEYPQIPLSNSKIIKGFFGLLDLPLTLQNTLIPSAAPGQNLAVRSLGQVDAQRLDEKGFRRFLKDANDLYNIKTDLLADYEATYQLDNDGWPVTADFFLL